jgi:hypothetical protein
MCFMLADQARVWSRHCCRGLFGYAIPLIVALFLVVQSGCSKGTSGTCDFRLGSTIAPFSQECDQYDDVQENSVQSACEQSQPNGKWTDSGKCVGQVLATCRHPEAGGTITQYYYVGTGTDWLNLYAFSCTTGITHGTWCTGTDCP